MNIALDQLGVLNAKVNGLPDDAAQQAAILSQLWTVVLLEQSGNAMFDPIRTATAFIDQGTATGFAANVKSTCGTFCVLLYHGSALQQVVAGDASLVNLWQGRTALPSPAPQPAEVAEVTFQATSDDPAAIVDGSEGTMDIINNGGTDGDPNA